MIELKELQVWEKVTKNVRRARLVRRLTKNTVEYELGFLWHRDNGKVISRKAWDAWVKDARLVRNG